MTSQSTDNQGPETPRRRGLLRSSAVTGSMTFVSRILGLVRDVVLARVFGPGDGADAFFLAFKIPNFLRRLFAEGAFNQAFVPVLSEYRSTRSLALVQELVNAVAGYLGAVLLLITAVVVLAAPWISIPIAYGFTADPAKFALFVDMLRITFPYLLLISLTAFAGSILNSYDRFAIPALTPALLNLSLIASALLLSPYFAQPEIALAWGVLIAGIAQLLFQLPFLVRLQLLPRPRLVKNHEGVRRIIKLMIPALFGVSVSQINLLLDTFIASLLVAGSVSWLYFSERLMDLPLGIFAVAVATVVLPSLSRRHAERSKEEFSALLDWALRLILLIAVPASLALVLLAQPMIITLFQNDNFTANDVMMVTYSLQAYSLGLLAFMSIKIFAPGFYSRQDTRTPVRIGIIAMVANMVMNILLVFVLDMAHTGLALATSLSAYLNAGLLFMGLRREGVFDFQPGWTVFLVRLLCANAVMCVFLVLVAGDWRLWLQWDIWQRVWQMAVLCFGGMALYMLALLVSGMRPADFRRQA
ncbi:murein biosynthesis integral membrane protein MurJ [Pseudohongiella sp.]|uniref:Lipid II flippase MurJ n=1 Tax=marine sediment metagenome TaxID=412755 RepID=A0A0F9Z2Z9_9ZZZZ|nr:murein biosynthesis integral membrane protein MurJ [Pseudohongiella sp.]HDZ09269.1 murein biosynthesis integral membrane protein MurJ [Pseudohongiella sp.]HEA62133.1 murein biosynthesis integral membrane protein MurJ [Pseudohongiella sp.]